MSENIAVKPLIRGPHAPWIAIMRHNEGVFEGVFRANIIAIGSFNRSQQTFPR